MVETRISCRINCSWLGSAVDSNNEKSWFFWDPIATLSFNPVTDLKGSLPLNKYHHSHSYQNLGASLLSLSSIKPEMLISKHSHSRAS